MARWRPVWLAGFATLALSCGEGATEDGVTITEEMRAAVVRDSVPAPKANRTSAKIKPLVQDHAQAKLATSPSPAPAEERFPLYGTADYLFANIYRRMEMEENILGYMRRGTSFRARWTGERRGCRSGWAELANGGYICSGRGFTVTTEPFEPENAPIPPAVHDALPYAYGYTVRDNVPQYGELPDKQTEGEVFTAIRALRAWESNRAAEAVSTAVGPDGGVAAPAYAPVISRSPAGLFNLPEGAPRLPDALRAMMLKGFYVSLDGAIAAPSGDMFLRTVRGTFVRQDDLIMNTPPASRGVILGGDWQLPIAITHRKGMRATRLDPATN
ncbi:MAG: hypothetical protein KC417_16260, partial [Myxococcales bacterium]|nr:hypothetical protein [Myxococcales bacterium]